MVGTYKKQIIEPTTHFWLIQKSGESLELVEFDKASEMIEFMDNATVSFGEDGLTWNPIAVSMNYDGLVCMADGEYNE